MRRASTILSSGPLAAHRALRRTLPLVTGWPFASTGDPQVSSPLFFFLRRSCRSPFRSFGEPGKRDDGAIDVTVGNERRAKRGRDYWGEPKPVRDLRGRLAWLKILISSNKDDLRGGTRALKSEIGRRRLLLDAAEFRGIRAVQQKARMHRLIARPRAMTEQMKLTRCFGNRRKFRSRPDQVNFEKGMPAFKVVAINGQCRPVFSSGNSASAVRRWRVG